MTTALASTPSSSALCRGSILPLAPAVRGSGVMDPRDKPWDDSACGEIETTWEVAR